MRRLRVTEGKRAGQPFHSPTTRLGVTLGQSSGRGLGVAPERRILLPSQRRGLSAVEWVNGGKLKIKLKNKKLGI
jgi:hypothetical protein